MRSRTTSARFAKGPPTARPRRHKANKIGCWGRSPLRIVVLERRVSRHRRRPGPRLARARIKPKALKSVRPECATRQPASTICRSAWTIWAPRWWWAKRFAVGDGSMSSGLAQSEADACTPPARTGRRSLRPLFERSPPPRAAASALWRRANSGPAVKDRAAKAARSLPYSAATRVCASSSEAGSSSSGSAT